MIRRALSISPDTSQTPKIDAGEEKGACVVSDVTATRIPSPERKNWRDERISRWHRDQHYTLAMTDIDWLVIEMRFCEPVALIDYKRMTPRELEDSTAIKGCRNLADMAGIPFFFAFYDFDPIWFAISPQNKRAEWRINASETIMASERDYVDFLFALRGEHAPLEALERLSTYTLPQMERMF